MRQDKEFIERAVDLLDKMELWGMTLITKVISIITPIPVSLQTQKHAYLYLGYSVTWSWVIALIVEFMGYAAIYKALQFAEHNRRYTDAKNKAPFKLAIATYAFYLIAVIVFNVIPELATNQKGFIVAMNLVLALFSVPGGVLAGISAIFTERKAAMKRGKNGTEQPERTENTTVLRTQQRTPRVLRTQTENVLRTDDERQIGFPVRTDMRENVKRFVMSVREMENRTPGVREVARAVGCAPSYAHTVIKNMKESENV